MNARILLATASLAITTTAFAADKTFDRTLNVSGSPNVSVQTGSGYIRLKPGSDNQIHITGHVHGNNGWMSGGSDVESRVQQIANNPPIVQNGNDITIGQRHGDNDLFRNISIDYDVTLPRTSNINAATGSGDMTIDNVGATLKAQTGSGSVRLQGVNGALKASTGSGDIEVQGNPSTDWKLSTGSGTIHMNLGSGAKFNLVADTGSGSVDVSQPISMQGSLNKHHISGTVNGGGPTIHANTGSGDISIR